LNITTIILFAVLGTLGGLVNVFMWAESWEDLRKFGTFKTVVLGSVIGFIYFFLYSDNNFPNGVMAFVSGYMGKDFIQAVIEKFKKK